MSHPVGTETSWTVGSLLNWTAQFLGQKGAEFPRPFDAEVLLAHAHGLQAH